MKYLRLSTLLLMSLFIISASAQDLIVKKDGSVIKAKVAKVGTAEVEYKKWSNQDGPQYSIAISDILAINYQNGEKESFENVSAKESDMSSSSGVNTNTPKEIQPIVADDNKQLICLYNNQIVKPVSPKYKDKFARRMFTIWGITDNSVLSDSHITVYFSKVYSDIVPTKTTGYALFVQNKSDETVYIDLANSFKISDKGISEPYYTNKTYTVNKSSGSGGSLNIGAVANTLGVGGSIGTLANGVNVGGGTSSGTTVTETEERYLIIPPHSKARLPLKKVANKKAITEIPERFETAVIPSNMNLKLHEYKEICTQENSTSIHRRIITYSTSPDFLSYKKLNIGIYLKGGLGDYWSSLTYLYASPESIEATNWDYFLIGSEVAIPSAFNKNNRKKMSII